MGRWGILVLLPASACLLSTAASAAYNDECRSMATRLATDPGSLKVGELDLLKSCLSDLQRSLVLGEPPPAKGELPTCAPQPATACPVCPVATACPAAAPEASSAPASSAPAAPARAKPRPREEDRRLKPYLPTY